jgi:hypothetical protein
MIVVVTGGRDFRDAKKIFETLDKLHATNPITLIVEGGADGADAIAHDWGLLRKIPVKTYRADWHAHGKGAGPIRNRKMLTEEKVDLVVAFPGGRGTANCVEQARENVLKIMKVT